jgi:hypothetical protein
MYGARLVDALAADYPRVATTLGWERFRETALGYVGSHPSTHFSLRWFGSHFGKYLAAVPSGPEFLCDLARLEWARVMVFDAPNTPLLHVDTLRRLAPEDWPTLHLRAVPALEEIEVEWPVHHIWTAAETGPPSGTWPRGPLWLRVWRQGDEVFQTVMDLEERTALRHVRAGDDFATLCTGLATLGTVEDAARSAGALVLRWIEDRLLLDEPTS